MKSPNWQLQNPIQAIIFDCDGTLSTVEGIDELAKVNGVSQAVKTLTTIAMSQSGINPDLYQKRLDLVYPNQDQVLALGHQYFTNQVPDVADVIRVLQRLNKNLYVVSAGLFPAVKIFGQLLQIPHENIFAVDIQFDEAGNFIDYEKTSPLINNHGKCEIVKLLKNSYDSIIHIGDGLNDIVTRDLVTRFIGYGGVCYRENIAELCQYYIRSASLAPLLPLSLTQNEYEMLLPHEQSLFEKGMLAIHEGNVRIT